MNKKEYFHFVPLTLLRQINSPQEYETKLKSKSVSVSKPEVEVDVGGACDLLRKLKEML